MSPGPLDTDAYTALAAESLDYFVAELGACGITTAPALRLETSHGVVSYYDRARVLISVAVPGVSGPGAALQALYLRSVLGLDDDQMLDALVRFCVPFTVAHELGHHLRDYHRRFSTDLWEEERVANLVASALQKRRYSPAERRNAVEMLGRALEHLAPRVASTDVVFDSYGSLLAALNVAGLISAETLSGISLVQKYVSAGSPGDSVGELLPVELLRRMENRETLVRRFSESYSSDVLRYVYYQLGWLLISMSSGESFHIDALAREYLGGARALLPAPAGADFSDAAEVRALNAASRSLGPRSAVAAAYFDRRYREALLARLEASEIAAVQRAAEAARNLASTDPFGGEHSHDPLDLIAPLVSAEARELLPAKLAASSPPSVEEVSGSLTAATDRRLYAHAALGADDEAASETLARLGVLWGIELFAQLPLDATLQLVESLAVVHARTGQTVIWEGDNDLDIYCVHEGRVEVVDGNGQRVRLIGAGGMFGEIPYLLRSGRSKTVRAVEPTSLLAVPERELSYLLHRHPEIGLQIARTLAQRLD